MTVEAVVETTETLAEYKAARISALAEPAKEEPKAEPEAEKSEDEPDEAKEPEKEPVKKGNHKIESRFSELTAKARAAEERASAAEARAEAAEAKSAPPAKAAEKDEIGPEPKPADYTDAFDYAKDLAEWSTNKALNERDKQDAEKVRAKEHEKVVGGWRARVEAVKVERPDWAEMVASSKAAVSDPARDALIESEFGPQIVYDMSEDDELADKVSAMKPAEQLRWIGRMEAKYEAQSESAPKETKDEVIIKERPRAPAPITAVKGGKSADNPLNEPGEFKGSYSEYKAWRAKQRK